MMTPYDEPDTETKILGGLIAKRIVSQSRRVPDSVQPEYLDAAAEYVLKRSRHKGSVQTAKREALRLLGKARELGSFRAAMDLYRRELRQLHEMEKQRGWLGRPRVRAFAIAAGVAAVALIVLVVLVLTLR